MCSQCETVEKELECEDNELDLGFDLDELYRHSYAHIAHMVREDEYKKGKGIVLH